MSKSIPKNRRAAFKNQGGLCYYCGFPMWLSDPERFAIAFKIAKSDSSRFQCTAEHLVAKQKGGGNSAVNIVAACRFCNSRRQRRSSPPSPSAHKKRVQQRLGAGKWHPSHLRCLMSRACRPTQLFVDFQAMGEDCRKSPDDRAVRYFMTGEDL